MVSYPGLGDRKGGGGGRGAARQRRQIDDNELYLEYLSIQQGSGYLPAMDGKLP